MTTSIAMRTHSVPDQSMGPSAERFEGKTELPSGSWGTRQKTSPLEDSGNQRPHCALTMNKSYLESDWSLSCQPENPLGL